MIGITFSSFFLPYCVKWWLNSKNRLRKPKFQTKTTTLPQVTGKFHTSPGTLVDKEGSKWKRKTTHSERSWCIHHKYLYICCCSWIIHCRRLVTNVRHRSEHVAVIETPYIVPILGRFDTFPKYSTHHTHPLRSSTILLWGNPFGLTSQLEPLRMCTLRYVIYVMF